MRVGMACNTFDLRDTSKFLGTIQVPCAPMKRGRKGESHSNEILLAGYIATQKDDLTN